MNHEEIVSRIAELNELMTAEGSDLEAIELEVRSLKDADEALKRAAAEEAEKREAVATGEVGENIKPVIKEEKHMNTLAEIRSSNEYALAYLHAIKGDETEARALLSTNATSGGYVPVPTLLENEIRNAWEEYGVMALVKKSYYPGNVKIGFELSASDAAVHGEGNNANDQEVITFGAVELKAESIKKWITVSDEAIEGTTIDTVGYLYKEIAHKIVEKAEAIMIGKITAASTSNSSTACGVAELGTETLAIDTIVKAVAKLSAQARNIHILMNRQTYAAVKATALNNKWGADPFDGLKDNVVFTDKLPAYSAATSGDAYIIAGDFAYGAQANFPNGTEMTIKLDDTSLAEQDLVKLVGRQYVGMGIVAPFAFVRVTK